MDSSWFEGKRALDIGCNSGAVTIEIAERFRPKHIMGLDIDPSLIAKARANVICKACRHQPKPGGQSMAGGVQGDMRLEHQALLSENGEPLSVSAHNGTERRLGRLDLDLSLLPDSDAEPFAFPYNCSFRREDYCEDPCIDARYDAVLCLSVTKWVHYNRGDEGVKKLFSKVYRSLREGGRFILEWQEWSSYKKKKTLTPLFKANCAAIRLHPGSFRDYLVAEVGFKSAIVLNPPKGNSEGFQRPLVVFEK
jgi:7SK snRNA methylphosphate capping enzyme